MATSQPPSPHTSLQSHLAHFGKLVLPLLHDLVGQVVVPINQRILQVMVEYESGSVSIGKEGRSD